MSLDAGRKPSFLLWRYAMQSLGAVVFIAGLIRIFFVSSYVMSGDSMLPNVWPGDFLLAAKWSVSEPRRGDIFVLRCPPSKDHVCMRRVIGLPGDRVEFKDRRLTINGQAVKAKALKGEFTQESLASESWAIWPSPENETMKEPIVVPPGQLFLLNDKRAEREDGRQWGAVSSELLEARVLRIWLSLDWFERTGETRVWPRIRWSRLLRRVD